MSVVFIGGSKDKIVNHTLDDYADTILVPYIHEYCFKRENEEYEKTKMKNVHGRVYRLKSGKVKCADCEEIKNRPKAEPIPYHMCECKTCGEIMDYDEYGEW